MPLREILEATSRRIADFEDRARDRRITPTVTAGEIRRHLESVYGGFSDGAPFEEVLDDVGEMMLDWNLHVTHPRYFGLFNPSVFPSSVAADLLVAAFNPQLAAWSHAPAANEIERHTLRILTGLLGLDPDRTSATFTSGGAEANQSAVIAALTHAVPDVTESGLAALAASPTLYVTSESHHSVEKAVHVSGLGRDAVRTVATDAAFRMSVPALCDAIGGDRKRGRRPFLVVATAGTTGGGTVDPLTEIAEVCRQEDLWLHVDAAWGGAACLSPRLATALAGIERADSITWDAHKWLSVPMGAGMFFCVHPEVVRSSFGTHTAYMPADVDDTRDPYSTTMQWSRRHIGLKLFMTLATLGTSGYRAAIEHQADMADRLREELSRHAWRIVNRTPLPVVCFTRDEVESGATSAADVATRLQERNFWISPVGLGDRADEVTVLRACITSYRTSEDDVAALARVVTEVAAAGTGR